MSDALVRTMSGQLTTVLRERIVMGDYAPGAQLLQDSIAAEFGVSKIPVREALVQLRAEGLIDIYAHRGFQVRRLSATEVEEVFHLRLLLEPAAVAEGAARAEAADRLEAKAALQALNDALAQNRLKDSGDLNRAYHLALIVPRLQPVSAEILGRLHVLSRRYVRLHLMPAGRAKRANREHVEIFKAWNDRKAREVARLTAAHIEETRRELKQAFEEGKSTFDA